MTQAAAAAAGGLWARVGSPQRAVAVVAHPDDESFGLGAVLAALIEAGTEVSVVCLTRGEASTLGAAGSLGDQREQELRDAASMLGIADVVLYDFPDGALDHSDQGQLEVIVDRHTRGADLVVVFEPEGVTGHPDHRTATSIAERIAGRQHIGVLEWGVAPAIATSLREELGAPFAALDSGPGNVFEVTVDRTRQRAAIACHGSQATDNSVLARRLQLQGDRECLRYRPAVTEERCCT